MVIVSVHKSGSGSHIAGPYVGDTKQCNASNAFVPRQYANSRLPKNTWTHSMMTPRLFIVHTQQRVETPFSCCDYDTGVSL